MTDTQRDQITPSKRSTHSTSRALSPLLALSLLIPPLSACDSESDPPLEPPIGGSAGVEGGVSAGVSAGAGVEEATWLVEAEEPERGVLMNVWGDGERVWAVGGQPERGVLWSRASDAPAGEGAWEVNAGVPEGPLLNWVHGAGGHLWVVGNKGRALRSVGGGEWELFDTGTLQDLWGVFVVSPSEVWAVGGNASGEGEAQPVLARFDGEAWTLLQPPELDRSGVRAFFKVWSDGEGRVWAVGMKGVIIGDLGGGWRQQQVTPAEGAPPNSEDLISLWGGGGELVAVGGRSNGVIARWDSVSSSWRSQTIAGLPGLNGVWVDERGVASAVGVRGSAVRVEPQSFEVSRERTYTSLVLHAVWSDGVRRWAVGGSLDSAPPWEGVILAD